MTRVLKPALFALCLLPLVAVLVRAFEVGGASLGANPIESIQDMFGRWGLRLLLVTLAITPLRDWFGATWLIGLRRMLGLFAFGYVVLHFLTWLVLDQSMYWPGIADDVMRRPFITIGFAALLLLLPLALTSTNRAMRRLGRHWKSLHRLSYAIALLDIWHYYWQAKADTREPVLYLVIASVLLGWRGYRLVRRRNRFNPSS